MSYRRKKNNLVTEKDEEEKSSILDLSEEEDEEYNNDEKDEGDDEDEDDEENIESYLTEYQNKTGIKIILKDDDEDDAGDDVDGDDVDGDDVDGDDVDGDDVDGDDVDGDDDLQEDADDFEPAKGDEYDILHVKKSDKEDDVDDREDDDEGNDEEDEDYEVIDAEPILDEPSITAAEEVKTVNPPIKEGGKPKKIPPPKVMKKSSSLYIDRNTEFSDPVYIEQIKARYEYKPKLVKEIVYIHPENRMTSERMTIFEYAEVISIRAKQIQHGAPCYTDVEKLTDPIRMAKKEIEDRRCPLDIVRMITDKIAERWHVNEMIMPNDFST
jgi:DNA-directed RNA polymerase subunit K/omega